MGTCHAIMCKECKVYRYLDKFDLIFTRIESREDALEYCDEIKKDTFRAGLLVSFMGKHMGHDCMLISEHSNEWNQHVWNDSETSFKEDADFWERDDKC